MEFNFTWAVANQVGPTPQSYCIYLNCHKAGLPNAETDGSSTPTVALKA